MGDSLWDEDDDFLTKELSLDKATVADEAKRPNWPSGDETVDPKVAKRAAELEAQLGGKEPDENQNDVPEAELKSKPEPEPELEEDEDDDEVESTSVQKRMDELTFKRREAERREAAAKQETAALAVRLDRLEQGDEKENMERFKQKYSQVRADLEQAFENGDSKEQVELTEELSDMRTAARIASMRRSEPSASQSNYQPPQQQPAAPPEATEWFNRNNTWFDAPGYEQQTTLARSIDVQLDLEGYDKDSPEYYEELDGRIKNVFNDLPVRGTVRPRGAKSAKRSSSPVAPAGAGGRSKGKRKATRFTPAEANMARELGLTSEDALKEYRKELDAKGT